MFPVRGGGGNLISSLFCGGEELFCDLVESVVVVVVGEIVLVPVLVPALVPVEFVSSAGMPSSRTGFLPTGGDERHGHQVGG